MEKLQKRVSNGYDNHTVCIMHDIWSRKIESFTFKALVLIKALVTYLAFIQFSLTSLEQSGVALFAIISATLASKMRLDTSLPISAMTLRISGSNESSLIERTLLTCTPRLLWIPEQVMHKVMPRLMEAHSGFKAPKMQGHLPKLHILSKYSFGKYSSSQWNVSQGFVSLWKRRPTRWFWNFLTFSHMKSVFFQTNWVFRPK